MGTRLHSHGKWQKSTGEDQSGQNTLRIYRKAFFGAIFMTRRANIDRNGDSLHYLEKIVPSESYHVRFQI